MHQLILTYFLWIFMSVTAFASASGSETSSMLSLDLLYKGINFVILLYLLHKFARKPIVKMLSSNAENTKKTLDNAQIKLEEAETKYAAYEAKIATLEKQLETRQQSNIASIAEERKQIIAEAENQARKLEEQAESRIEQDLIRAKSEIREYLATTSVKLAEQIITKEIGSQDHKILIANYAKSLKETA